MLIELCLIALVVLKACEVVLDFVEVAETYYVTPLSEEMQTKIYS